MAILAAGDHPYSESVKVRHSPLASENWTITWKQCKIGGTLTGLLHLGHLAEKVP